MFKKIISVAVVGVIGAISNGKSLDISGNAPVLTIAPGNPASSIPQVETFRTSLNATLKTTFDNTLDTARKNLKGFKSQKNLAEGFGNANAYSMNSATLQGFQNYSLFAVATGLMVGVQAPSTSLSYYSKIGDEITKNGDLYAGLGVGFTYLNIGVNAGFLMPGLYVNAKYGAQERKFGDFSLDFSVMGFGVNYRILDTKSLIGIIKWRGISLGSGFYMQSDKLNMAVTPDTIKNAIPFGKNLLGETTGAAGSPERIADSTARANFLTQLGLSTDPSINLVPSFDMGLDVSTMTIPLDAVTAVSVLWGLFNVTAGVGIDLNFGSNKIVLVGTGKTDIKTDTTKASFAPAKVVIDGSSTAGPSFARMRFMTGLGLGLGPVKLDIPVIYYPASGMAFGLTAAVVW
jgi:hypothetical protein